MSVAGNLNRVRERISAAAANAAVRPEDIKLIAVTKTVDVPRMTEAIAAGATDVGENYVQDALAKWEAIGPKVCWHMIGRLQTNKVRHAVRMFDLIHSVDGLGLAQEIGKRSMAIGKTSDILIEVNISGEQTKSGVAQSDALRLAENVTEVQGVRLLGLMGIAPFVDDSNEIRRSFRRLRKLWDELPAKHRTWLSMGMTSDFEMAIEEGSNMVRIGTAIFGPRG